MISVPTRFMQHACSVHSQLRDQFAHNYLVHVQLLNVVGNKIDYTERKVSKSVMEQLLPSPSDIPYFEISAKENIGIEEVSLYIELGQAGMLTEYM